MFPVICHRLKDVASNICKEINVMRKNYGVKAYSYPQPVFIIASYDESGKADAMNAAWGGISDSNEISICLSAGHKTTKNILAKKAFTISMGDAKHVDACDYVGIVSANDETDKLKKAGFTVSKSELIDAPVINELAVCIECKLKSYDENTGRLVAEIINVSVDENALDENGNVDITKVEPITFDPFNNTYVKLGDVVGKAFSDGNLLK